MKTGIKIAFIIVLAILAIGLASVMVIGIIQQERGMNVSILAIGYQTTKLFEQEYPAGEIQKIEVKAQSSKIEVIESDTANIKVTAYGMKDEVIKANQGDGYLTIEKPPVFHLFLFCAWCDEKIIVEVPKGSAKDYTLETTSGSIHVPDGTAGTLQVKSTSGSIRLGNGGNLTAQSSSGKITAGNFQTAEIKNTSGGIETGNLKEGNLTVTSGSIRCGNVETGKLESSSGSIRMENGTEITARTTSGRIQVQEVQRLTARTTSGSIAVEKIDGYCNLSTTSGGIKVEECILKENSEMSAKSGSIHLKKKNDFFTDAHATSGSIKIEDNNRKAEVELKARTTSGSIRVSK